MCGRFTLTEPAEAMARLFDAAPANDLPEGPRYNICPTQRVTSVISRGGARRLVALRWGFLPSWYKSPTDGPLIINARADTIARKPAFREAARQRRCLIPASGFYEWSSGPDGARLPWYITASDGGPLALAGIWQTWERGAARYDTCALVTTDAGPGMTHIHHREPVTVAPGDWPLWLGEAGHGAARLMQAAPEGRLRAHRVSPEVNSNRAKGPSLIAPIAAD